MSAYSSAPGDRDASEGGICGLSHHVRRHSYRALDLFLVSSVGSHLFDIAIAGSELRNLEAREFANRNVILEELTMSRF